MQLNSRSSHTKRRNLILGRRFVTQTVFILVHVLLIKVAIPNVLWAILGLLFWGGLVFAAVRSGKWVCASICWLGGIQDLMYRWAKKRVNFSPKVTQWAVLIIVTLWTPLAWLLVDGAMFSEKGSPLQNPLAADENIFAQAGHFIILLSVGLTVTIFGPRGACHYLCPFGMVVSYSRTHKLNQQLKQGNKT